MQRQILLDSNLLVLLVVGLTEPALVGRHKRTRNFAVGDFDLLLDVLKSFSQVLVTPQIVTEASNLISQIEGPIASRLRQTLAKTLNANNERHEDSRSLCTEPEYLRLGITDAAVLRIAKQSIPILTVDLDLYLAAARFSGLAVNFNHIRQTGWLKDLGV